MVNAEIQPSPSTWEIILLWTGVSALSIFGGIWLGAFLNDRLWISNLPSCPDCICIFGLITNPIQRVFIYGLSIGGIKSILEESVLRKWKVKWNGWVLVSMLGWAIGVTIAEGEALAIFPSNFGVNQLLGGMIIGLSQWIILRRYLPKAYWWIIANVIGSFAILSYVPYIPLGGYTFSIESSMIFIITGFFTGIMTSATLSWLLSLSWLEEW